MLQSYLDCETLPDGTLVARVDPDRTAPEGMAAVLLQNAMAAVTGGSPASSINGGTPPRRHSGASPGFPSRSSSSSSLASWLTPIGPARHPPAPRDPMAGAAAGSSASSVGSASTVGSGGSVSSSKGGSGSLYKTSGNASASSYTPPRNLHSLGQLRRQQTPAEAAASAAAIAAWSSGIRRRDSGSESGGAGAGAGRRRSRPDGVAASWEEEDERARAAAQRVNSMAKSASWCCPPGMAPLPRARKITVERTSSVGDLSGSAAAADAPMATATVPPADGGPEFTRVLAQVYEDDACTGAGREREDVFTALARAVKEAAAQSKQAALETSTSLTKRATEAGTVLKNPRALLQQLPVTGGGAVAGITAGVKGLWVGVGGKEGKGSASANPSPGAAAGVEETKAGEPMTGSSSVAAPAPAQEGAEPPQPGMEAAEGAKKKKERKEKDKEKRSKDKGKAGKEGKEGGKKEKKEKKSKREKPPQQEGAGEAAVEAEQQLAPVEPAAAIEA